MIRGNVNGRRTCRYSMSFNTWSLQALSLRLIIAKQFITWDNQTNAKSSWDYRQIKIYVFKCPLPEAVLNSQQTTVNGREDRLVWLTLDVCSRKMAAFLSRPTSPPFAKLTTNHRIHLSNGLYPHFPVHISMQVNNARTDNSSRNWLNLDMAHLLDITCPVVLTDPQLLQFSLRPYIGLFFFHVLILINFITYLPPSHISSAFRSIFSHIFGRFYSFLIISILSLQF